MMTEMPWGFNCSCRCYGDSANGGHVNGGPSYLSGRAAMGSAEFFTSLRCSKIFVTETAVFALEDDSCSVQKSVYQSLFTPQFRQSLVEQACRLRRSL